jgi:3-methylcrotonyl-CoA carboxylase alpha subunit
VVHAADRASALAALTRALKASEIAGSTTNIGFLAALSQDPDFASGDVDTGLIARKQPALVAVPKPDEDVIARAVLAASGTASSVPSGNDPWELISGYGHFHPLWRQASIGFDGQDVSAFIRMRADGRFEIRFGDEADPLVLAGDGQHGAVQWPGHITVFSGGAAFDFKVPDPFAKAAESGNGASSMRAPMPGLVKLVRAAKGDAVIRNQPLLILEAMKMEHTITAQHDGIIAEIAAEGTQVTDGTVLVRFEEAPTE